MTRQLAFASVLTALAAGAPVGTPAMALTPVPGFIGVTPSSVAGCPYIMWRLARHDNGEVTGIAYYSDLSGVSTVNGMVNQSGQIQLTLASSMGKGPVGTVTGTKSADGAITAQLAGTGCASARLHMGPTDLNDYHHVGGE